jgi:prepilin-type N-terminal cleavage/methylation domain-containing protein
MKRTILIKQQGFTLIELLVVMFMLGLVIMALYSVYTTHQRSAYVQDEVVEVQQNLRIAMDKITNDIRMAGLFIPTPTTATYNAFPVQATGDAAETLPDGTFSDTLTLNAESSFHIFATITQSATPVFTVAYADSVDAFNTGDTVRIIRANSKTQPGGNCTYKVTGTNRNPPQITLGPDTTSCNSAPAGTFQANDVIVRVESNLIYPITITYCLGSQAGEAGCGGAIATCPSAPDLCLMRILNIGTANQVNQLIAQNMSGLQISYLMNIPFSVAEASSLVDPVDVLKMRAVRVTLIGRTVKTTGLSDKTPKQRQLESVIGFKEL